MPVLEQEGLLSGSNNRPANILLRGWLAGCDTCQDITATNACQAVIIDGCAADGAFAMEMADALKLHAYPARPDWQSPVFFAPKGASYIYPPYEPDWCCVF